MQISRVEVIPVELNLRQTARMAGTIEMDQIQSFFIRVETRQGQNAWGCCVVHPELIGETIPHVYQQLRTAADMLPDLSPLNLEYTLAELSTKIGDSPAAMCAFDMALHDLLSLTAGLPLYRVLGGFRDRIRTSATIPLANLEQSVDFAEQRSKQGFRILKIKGGSDPEEDVRRVHAIHTALPNHILRLDADGGYSIRESLDVSRALDGILEMLEQPTPAGNLASLRQVTEQSPIPILADQSLTGPGSALELATHKAADGVIIKLVTCGGLRCAKQIDSIARAANIVTMVGCFLEPALLISAGLSLALSSPNVRYGDLDGFIDVIDDPSRAGFILDDGWLIATDVPGLGYTVNLT